MKIVHLNTSNKGGAGIAALRLHEWLLRNGVDSKFLSLYSFPSASPAQFQFRKRDCSKFPLATDTADFVFKVMKKLKLRQPYPQGLEAKYLKGRPEGFDLFSFPFSEYRINEHPLVKEADIVHLHWVSDGFLDYETFFSLSDKKIVWTLHDMNPFTGGCHHADGCMKFTHACDICPQLKGTRDPSYSSRIISVKKSGLAHVSDKQVQIISPSAWLTKLSEQSNLFHRFRHTTIANVMNNNLFTFRKKAEVRRKLSIPADKKVILFVAHHLSNARKGGQFLIEALKHLENDQDLILCSVGSETDSMKYPLQHMSLGYVNEEERMADLYSAADLFVLPSMAENFPNTICESLLCGTPVVAFNVGGIPELVDESNGKLATPYNSHELASAIRFVLERPEIYRGESISQNAHRKLNSELNTNRYIAVYSDLLKSHA